MKKEKLSNLSLQDLQTRVAQERERLAKLQFSHAVTPLENPNQLGNAKREIARMLTAITQKQAA
jgi:large subunit ribosomal protein L29